MALTSLCAASFAVLTSASFTSPPDWVDTEKGALANHVQLTFSSEFVKAGESYFSPDDSKIIFQAVPVPSEGQEPEPFYQMYVADVVYDEDGSIVGLKNYKCLSPSGSWNTCGWFHPTKPDTVIFGSTIVTPEQPKKVGFQRGTDRYAWSFPKEMTIVECTLNNTDSTTPELHPLIEDDEAYLAECVISNDGRFLVYCRRAESDGNLGGDLLVRDLKTGKDVIIAGNAGYDGGPFFSPDGRRLCYRSDRRGNNLLQIFVAELDFDAHGNLIGLAREYQLTNNDVVNWAPFWTNDGRRLVYTTSELGHTNYEVFMIDADSGDASAGSPTRYGTRKVRITYADKFDGLPAFNHSGSKMIWTSQRSADHASQIWAADFVYDLEQDGAPIVNNSATAIQESGPASDRIYVKDPETGKLFVYNPDTHEVVLYDAVSHETEPVELGSDAYKRAFHLFKEMQEVDD